MSVILTYSMLAGLGTAIGAVLVLLFGRPSRRRLAFLLGCAAGIMLGVVFCDLIPSAFSFGSPIAAVIGVIVGIIFLYVFDALLGLILVHDGNNLRSFKRMGYLIAIGIAMHDLPEGIAIAAGYAAPGSIGPIIALAIGLHNIPEGVAIAVPLIMAGINRLLIIGTTLLVSLFTPLGTFLGFLLINLTEDFVSPLLALAAGAMLYLVGDELIPEAIGQSVFYTGVGILFGIILMIFLP